MWGYETQLHTLPAQTPWTQVQPHHSCKPQDLHILPLLGYHILSKGVKQFLNIHLCLKTRQAFGKKRQRQKTLEMSCINKFKEGLFVPVLTSTKDEIEKSGDMLSFDKQRWKEDKMWHAAMQLGIRLLGAFIIWSRHAPWTWLTINSCTQILKTWDSVLCTNTAEVPQWTWTHCGNPMVEKGAQEQRSRSKLGKVINCEYFHLFTLQAWNHSQL